MKIYIENITTSCLIGIHDWEQTTKQPLYIDLTLTYDATETAAEDNIEKAVDYDTLTKSIIAYTETHQYGLIETLADKLLDLTFNNHPSVKHAEICIKKPKALEGFANFAAVTHEKSRTSQ